MSSRAIRFAAVAILCLLLAPEKRPSAASGSHASQPLHSRPRSGNERPSDEEFAELAQTRPLAMLEVALQRCESEVHGFRARLTKQERMGGKLYPAEKIQVSCREEPFAVMMRWTEGYRSAFFSPVFALRYDSAARDPMLVYRPDAYVPMVKIGPRDASARSAARSGIEESGMPAILRRTLLAWTAAAKKGELTVAYLGVQQHPDLGLRPCHVLRRTCNSLTIDPFLVSEPPVAITDSNRDDAFDHVTIWIDCETWCQIGTEQTRGNELVARYFFNVTDWNPTFSRDEFSPDSMKQR